MKNNVVKYIEVFNIKDDDIVILRCEYLLSEKDKQKIKDTWSNIFRKQGLNNIEVIVLSNNPKIEVLSKPPYK